MTMSPEQYAKRMAEATVPTVPNRAPSVPKPTQPQLARALEEKLKAAKA